MNGFSMTPTADPRDRSRVVDAFNARHPVGTPVVVSLPSGTEREGITQSLAFIGACGPLVQVTFPTHTGTFHVSRLRAAHAQP